MSEYQQFLQERDRIDFLIQKGYRIKKVTESLNGDIVEFENKENNREETKVETLHILTPNARKYFSAKLLQQKNIQAKK
ncbi:hypothetical protein [Heyndrickxia acidicola]|uniref:Uncharacterized protein n=1 Tax=Heyndrickxia acidicola TaxID=209389 RepID=A0ABU6MAS9_9BACI|nr:hypothetical protein [Heyndrickxia acidicola]MED1201502.1 hypothetical protein [Heyndrickxia acidicola]